MNFEGKDFSFELGKRTYIMGILNITPDSFYDGGLYNSVEKALSHAEKLVNDGADIIDIGAQSTRPGHIKLTEDEELKRIIPYIDALKSLNCVKSVDSYYPKVMEYAVSNGVQIINDVSANLNEAKAILIKKYSCGYIAMHNGGKNSDGIGIYKNGIISSIKGFFDDAISYFKIHKLDPFSLCLDSGIGFGKSDEDNIEIIRRISELKRDDFALMTALSNKRVVKARTGDDKIALLSGTIAANTIAISGKTDFIRVHNVKEAKATALVADKVLR